jgi:hypothetical protein
MPQPALHAAGLIEQSLSGRLDHQLATCMESWPGHPRLYPPTVQLLPGLPPDGCQCCINMSTPVAASALGHRHPNPEEPVLTSAH